MNTAVSSIETIAFTLCLIALPIIYIIAFASHPNLLNMKPTKDANSWVSEFRHNKKLHVLHLLVLGSSLLIINITFNLMSALTGDYALFGMIGGTLAIIGAIALAADKGALCLVPSAFDTLDDKQFNQLMPGLQTLLDNKGYIGVIHLLLLLPIGFIIMSIGLMVAGTIPIWQGVTLIIGMGFMINPDIDLLSLIGSCFMMVSLGSMGIGILF